MAFPHIKRGTPNGSFTKCYPCSRFILLPMFPVAPLTFFVGLDVLGFDDAQHTPHDASQRGT
jgi:hypothetical protein